MTEQEEDILRMKLGLVYQVNKWLFVLHSSHPLRPQKAQQANDASSESQPSFADLIPQAWQIRVDLFKVYLERPANHTRENFVREVRTAAENFAIAIGKQLDFQEVEL
jgi:hypothetical protein